ncbi:hypothetical protein AVL50_30690 [Flammeovirga sp. SJP92]|nr:hypothetical protein AVL50_30690 [Flammeovirga sp. SJP92]
MKEIEVIVKYGKLNTLVFTQENGKKYVACNFPDSLIVNQNYKVILKLLNKEQNEKWVGQPCEIVTLEILNEQHFESLKKGHRTLFVGGRGKTDKDKSITNGIYVTKVSDAKIKYTFTELINWKKQREILGEAILQKTKNDRIEVQNKEYESAFRFFDTKNNVEIFITKEFKIHQAKAKFVEIDKSNISGLMYNK